MLASAEDAPMDEGVDAAQQENQPVDAMFEDDEGGDEEADNRKDKKCVAVAYQPHTHAFTHTHTLMHSVQPEV